MGYTADDLNAAMLTIAKFNISSIPPLNYNSATQCTFFKLKIQMQKRKSQGSNSIHGNIRYFPVKF
jgi:hypothetical protein